MELLPYQQRVIDEQKDLYDKTFKLEKFIYTVEPDSDFSKLAPVDQDLLRAQHKAMIHYNSILLRRIQRFRHGL